MKQPKNWRQLQRHPLSAEYQDLAGPLWDAMLAGVRDHGIVDRTITLAIHDGTLKVLDGWQILRACKELGVKPTFSALPRKISPERFVSMRNDARRHESPEKASQRIAERRSRVQQAIAVGKKQRQIARDEGVSEKTIRNDKRTASAEGSAPGQSKTLEKPQTEFPKSADQSLPENTPPAPTMVQATESSVEELEAVESLALIEDELGVSVPAHLTMAIGADQIFVNAANALKAIEKTIADQIETKAPGMALVNVTTMRDEFRALRRLLRREWLPVVCPECGGREQKCGTCKPQHRGYTSIDEAKLFTGAKPDDDGD